MKNNEILAKLQTIMNDINEDVQLSDNTALIGENLLDSLELINYLTQIEEIFGVEISLEELKEAELGLVSNMIAYLSDRVY